MTSNLTHCPDTPRCPWCGTEPIYQEYHDLEWGVPEWDGRALWEKLILDGFQAGLSWITILKKRDNFRAAFEGFDPERIATWGEPEIDRLLQDKGIIRHRGKIAATITNAQAYLDLGGEDAFRGHDVGLCRRHPIERALQDVGRGADRVAAIHADLEGLEKGRVQVLRPDDRLCVDGGLRAVQQPSGQLPPARSGLT